MGRPGRPKKTLKDLPTDWKNGVLALYKEGASDVEAMVFLSLGDTAFNRMIREDPVFRTTIKRGRKMSQSWWENQGRTNLNNRQFSAVLWYMNMKNRFGWRDKQEIDHTTNGKDLPAPILGGITKIDEVQGNNSA